MFALLAAFRTWKTPRVPGEDVGPVLNGVVARRGAAFVRNKLADPTFNNATSMMPNFGLTDEQIEALVAYLATLNPGEPR